MFALWIERRGGHGGCEIHSCIIIIAPFPLKEHTFTHRNISLGATMTSCTYRACLFMIPYLCTSKIPRLQVFIVGPQGILMLA